MARRVREVRPQPGRSTADRPRLAAEANEYIAVVNRDYVTRRYPDTFSRATHRALIRNFSVVVSRNSLIRSELNRNAIVRAFRELEREFVRLDQEVRARRR